MHQDTVISESSENLDKILRITLKNAEKELGLKIGFFTSLKQSHSDWEFMAKIAQFMEGLIGKVLIDELDRPNIEEWISCLSQEQRLKLARILKIISNDQYVLLRSIAEIRNFYIHNIRNVTLNLNEYFSDQNSSPQKGILKIFHKMSIEFQCEKIAQNSIAEKYYKEYLPVFLENIRNEIVNTLAYVTLEIHGESVGRIALRKFIEFRRDQAEKLLPPMKEQFYLTERFDTIEFVRKAKGILKKTAYQ